MSMDKRFIMALNDDEEEILNKIAKDTGIKKSKLVRTLIAALKDINPKTMQIVIADEKHLVTGQIYNYNTKAELILNNVCEETVVPWSTAFTTDGEGNVISTKSNGWGLMKDV